MLSIMLMYLIEPCSHCDNDSISTFELVEHPIQIRQSGLCDSSKTSKFRFLQIDRIYTQKKTLITCILSIDFHLFSMGNGAKFDEI